MIRLEKVNKYFNRHKKNEIHVINDTSLTLPDTGLIALLGPSGSGKTTILNVIGGLDKVNKGKIYINDKKITKKSTGYVDKVRNLNIGYIFQNYYLVDDMSVFDNVALALKMVGIKNKNEIRNRVYDVLQRLKLYRYRNRPASMLSGGERQRVGIARAIIKDPSIILADEPTGNLDSQNTIEIMNIIKAISKNRLVILVTHENDIAKFYADRIIEIEDGKIKNDYDNKHNNSLDYRIDNKIYLKDFKYKDDVSKDITVYTDKKDIPKVTIVIKNNNIFIKTQSNEKVEVIDDDSNIELINDHYKMIDKSTYESYEFDFKDVETRKEKYHYSSIFNPISLLINGFKKLLDYTFIKKLLLLGFLASGAFIMYSVSNIFGITNVKDSDFITKNINYYDVKVPKVKVNDYLEYEKMEGVDYIIPGDSMINFKMKFDDYYQTLEAETMLTGSIVKSSELNKENIVLGRMPQNNHEIVVDKLCFKKLFEGMEKMPVQVGYKNADELLNINVYLQNMEAFTIVGMTNNNDNSIYIDDNLIIDALSNSYKDLYVDTSEEEETLINKDLFTDINLKKGRMPENDYEIVVSINKEYEMPLNKNINKKVNGKKLTVVGYYDNIDYNYYFTNSNTIKYDVISKAKDLTVMPSDKVSVVDSFNEKNLNIYSSYDVARNEYVRGKKEVVNAGLIVCGVMLAISFVEIYLMIRSSYLSRIKEIGIYRAIGVKKIDIYKMFYGEIMAITCIACVPGILFMAYALKELQRVSYFANNYLINPFTVLVSLVLVFAFNIIIGLLPIIKITLSTPAKILARKDLD